MHLQTKTYIAAITIIISSSLTYADFGDQLFKLIPYDGAEGDFFGSAVGISNFAQGKTAIVGAWGSDDYGIASGSAYLFDITNGNLIAKILPSDGEEVSAFGYSVGVSGAPGNEFAIIGAMADNEQGTESGAAYIFDTTNGWQLHKVLAEDGVAGDQLGCSVAMIGTTAIVGAKLDDDFGSNSGSAYLFNTSTGQQITKLLPAKGAMNDQFGFDVAITGLPGMEIAIVGSWLDDDNGNNSGSAYLIDVPTGKIITKLLPNDGAEDDYFGWSVGISGNIAIVAAQGKDDSGSAYLFDISDAANPMQIAKLLPDDNGLSDAFGWDVATNGSIAIVGDPWADDNGINSGSAFAFNATNGKFIAKLLPEDGVAGDAFGWSVAISNNSSTQVAIIGAFGDDPGGSAYLFDVTPTANCPWDLDDSGSVGTSDMLTLFSQWGTAGSADFDESGTVGTSDLLILFANWGPCP